MDIILLNASDQPIYQQIKAQLVEQILTGQLSEGLQLPSIRSLAKELHISVITTKRAYEELENEGYIDTVPGKGSFVSGSQKEVLKQERVERIKTQLREIVHDGKKYEMTLDQMMNWIKYCYEED